MFPNFGLELELLNNINSYPDMLKKNVTKYVYMVMTSKTKLNHQRSYVLFHYNSVENYELFPEGHMVNKERVKQYVETLRMCITIMHLLTHRCWLLIFWSKATPYSGTSYRIHLRLFLFLKLNKTVKELILPTTQEIKIASLKEFKHRMSKLL